jgi:peptidoglycan/LPS O-acetylase OafA/YrhL
MPDARSRRGLRVAGVFTGNPYRNAVNGSLWTLPHEVAMYLILVVWLALFPVQRTAHFHSGCC